MNKIFIISGPSGSGKTTLINMLFDEFNCVRFSVSHTTRKKRSGETDAKEYYFIDRDLFENMIRKDLFAEWAEVHGELYGTSLSEINKRSTGENILILDIDVQGAEKIKNKFPDSFLVFIMPPDVNELEQRLRKREKELNAEFRKRLISAKKEMERSDFYDKIITNDRLKESYKELAIVFRKYMKSVSSTDNKNS